MTYDELLMEYSTQELVIKEKPLRSSLGRIKSNKIAIKKDMPTVCKTCVLAEEIGHYYTGVGNILDQEDTSSIKQEQKGRIWAYEKLIGLQGIVEAYEFGCQSLYAVADYLSVTEEFLKDALVYYEQKYGICTNYECYIIYFIPSLSVLKRIDF